MVSILLIGLLVFPGAAVWVRRRMGIGVLWLLTALTVLAIVGLAGLASSTLGGNRRVQSYGFVFTFGALMYVVVTTILLPVLASAGVAAATDRRTVPAIAYLLAVLVMVVATVAGFLFAVYTLA